VIFPTLHVLFQNEARLDHVQRGSDCGSHCPGYGSTRRRLKRRHGPPLLLRPESFGCLVHGKLEEREGDLGIQREKFPQKFVKTWICARSGKETNTPMAFERISRTHVWKEKRCTLLLPILTLYHMARVTSRKTVERKPL
jgi:hypothetical protein